MKKLQNLLLCVLISFSLSCSVSPVSSNKQIEKGFKNELLKFKGFAKKHNNKKRKTRDPDVIRKYFQEAIAIVEYAEDRAEDYNKNLQIIEKRKLKYNALKIFDLKKYSYQFCKRGLKNKLDLELTKVKNNKKYSYQLKMRANKIFTVRPKGHKPGGSKKFEGIRNKFN